MIVVEENQIIIYKDENNAIQLDVKLKDGMIWVTRQQLATLFARDYKTISKHINNALREELADEVVVAKFANITQHGAIAASSKVLRAPHGGNIAQDFMVASECIDDV